MQTEELKKLFQEVVRSYDNDQTYAEELWEEIEKAYSEKGRYYHNLNHIAYMLEKAHEIKHLIRNWDALLFSIYYHDIVYDVKRKDNEEKSASIGSLAAANTGLGREAAALVNRQIVTTKKHKWSDDMDINYLTDIDLLILGEGREVYQNYTASIRKEYSRYLDFLYNMGHKKVLKLFLAMDRIYKTDYFRDRFEAQARENLKWELDYL